MPNVTVSTNVDTLLKSANNAEMRSNLGLGDAATKNTGIAAGTVAAGDDSRITGALQTSGGTMTGKLTAAADATNAKLSVGARTTGSSPATLADGDIWISNQGYLSYRDSSGPTSRAVATISLENTFNQPQAISSTANAKPLLTATNSGTREVATFINTATATSDAVVITNLGSGNSLVVNDETTPDSTRFAVANNGRVGIGVAPDASVALAVDSTGILFQNGIQDRAMDFGANTRTVGVDGATIQACINSITTASSTNQFQVLIPPGTYTENLTLKPCVSLAGTGANNGLTPISRIVGQHTFTGTATAANNIIQLSSLRFDNPNASSTFTLGAVGSATVLVQFDSCTINTSSASTLAVGVLAYPYVTVQANDTKSLCNATAGSGGTHFILSGGSLYGTNLSTEYGICAISMESTNGANKPYCELKNCDIRAVGANLVNITSNTALFTAGWCSFSNLATFAKGFNIAANSVVGVYNSSFTVTAGASNYLVDGSVGSAYFSALNNYSSSSLVAYETKISPFVTQVPYTTSIPNPLPIANGGTGQTTASAAINALVPSQSGNSGKVLSTNGTAVSWTASGGSGTVTSVDVSGGTTGLTTSGGPVTASGTITLAGTLGVANGGTGATTLTGLVKGSGTSALSAAVAGTDYVVPSGSITGTASNVTGTVAIANGGTGQITQQAAINALAGATTSGQYLRGNGTNVTMSTIQAGDVPTLNQNTTGTAAGLSSTLAVTSGGTGATTLTGIVKGNGTGAFTAASAGTDYVVPSGNITGTASNVTGTVLEANGGTGETTYTNGQLLIGNASGGLTKATLTAGSNVTITNGDGAITIAATGGGGGGITALTGDVTASGSGSVSATVAGIQSRTVASTAPTNGQVLGWNSSLNQWEPTSAGGAVSYDVLRVFFTGPNVGGYTIPSGYKFADMYACSGGAGGGSGSYTTSVTYMSGGGGGAHGIFGLRKSVDVQNASLSFDIGSGGAGGSPDPSTGASAAGQPGNGTLIAYSIPPTSGASSTIILDCGYYINNSALSTCPGQGGSNTGVNGGALTFAKQWVQNTQAGGNASAGWSGADPVSGQFFVETTYVSSGGGGGGVGPYPILNNGGNILDQNYVLYTSGTATPFNGVAGNSVTINATQVPVNPNLNIFWGGAGGASADSATAYYNGTIHTAGRGADGGYGCGGGGGGVMYDDLGMGPGSYAPGIGGTGGAGFLLMYLYK